MARVTVEDCMSQMDNLFQLVLVSTKRARQIAEGAEPFVPMNNDKPTVVALREIAGGFVTKAILDERETQTQLDLADLVAAANESQINL